MGIKIRKADLNDFNKIDSLSEELLGSSVGDRKEMFGRALKNSDYLCLVAEMNKEVVGFIDMWVFPDVSHGAYLAQVQNFVVAERMRGKGIGTRLIEEIIGVFRKRKYHELHVWTEKKNKGAYSIVQKTWVQKGTTDVRNGILETRDETLKELIEEIKRAKLSRSFGD